MADKVRDFSVVKVKKKAVKVPKLKIRKKKIKVKKDDKILISTIVSILIKNAVENVRKEKEKKPDVEDKKYRLLKDDNSDVQGGYGTVSRGYGAAPHMSYIDYGKLFSYLGHFKAKNPYDSLDHAEMLNKSLESRSFTLVDREAMEKGKRYIRYFHPKVPVDKTSLVPLPGMNSSDWEEFKMWMRLDTAMYLLKISTS